MAPNDFRANRPPHPATLSPRAQPFGAVRPLPPHAATIAQPKRSMAASRHVAQRMELTTTSGEKEKEPLPPLLAALTGVFPIDIVELIFSFMALEDLGKLALVCVASKNLVESIGLLGPGSRRIELGAGDMASALAFGLKETLTAFTEYDSYENLLAKYGEKLTKHLKVKESEQFIRNRNVIAYGVNAMQIGPFVGLPRTRNLRFTNPNIGSEELSDLVDLNLDGLLDADVNGTHAVCANIYGIWFTFDLARIKRQAQGKSKVKTYSVIKRGAHIANTSFSITCCCNMNLLLGFFGNAKKKLHVGGCVELIVKDEYIDRWPIVMLAGACGFKVVSTVTNYELGFENIHTQSSQLVNKQQSVAQYLYLNFEPCAPTCTLGELKDEMLKRYATFNTPKTQGNIVSGFSPNKPDLPEFELKWPKKD